MYVDFRFDLGDKVRVTEEYIATQDERAPKWTADMRAMQKVKPGEVVAMTICRKGINVAVEFAPSVRLNFMQSALVLA